MTHAAQLLALAALLGCSDLTAADGGIVAVETTVPSPATVAVGDNLQLSARALNKAGETVPAAIVWATPDATIAIDAATGLVTGLGVGTGRVQASAGSLSSALVTVTVVAAETPEAVRRAR